MKFILVCVGVKTFARTLMRIRVYHLQIDASTRPLTRTNIEHPHATYFAYMPRQLLARKLSGDTIRILKKRKYQPIDRSKQNIHEMESFFCFYFGLFFNWRMWGWSHILPNTTSKWARIGNKKTKSNKKKSNYRKVWQLENVYESFVNRFTCRRCRCCCYAAVTASRHNESLSRSTYFDSREKCIWIMPCEMHEKMECVWLELEYIFHADYENA